MEKIDIWNPCPTLDKAAEEIGRLKKSYELLRGLWFGVLSFPIVRTAAQQKLCKEIDDFFAIDDSE